MSENESQQVDASTRKSRKAVTSLTLAIVGVCGMLCFGLLPSLGLSEITLLMLMPTTLLFAFAMWALAILSGRRARKEIRASSEELVGTGLASAGMGLGAGCIVLTVLLIASWWWFVLYPVHSSSCDFLDRRGHKLSRVLTSMRSLATAIEACRVDTGQYPAWGAGKDGPGGTWTYNYAVAARRGDSEPRRARRFELRRLGPLHWYKRLPPNPRQPDELPCCALNGTAPGQRFAALTTPNAYIASYPVDSFSPLPGATFVYWSVAPGTADPSGGIVGRDSPTTGIGWILVSPGLDRRYDILPDDWDVYDPSVAQPTERLLAGTNKEGRAFTYDPTNGTISDGDVWRVKQ
jgi:hypothetical protein